MSKTNWLINLKGGDKVIMYSDGVYSIDLVKFRTPEHIILKTAHTLDFCRITGKLDPWVLDPGTDVYLIEPTEDMLRLVKDTNRRKNDVTVIPKTN